MNSSATTVFPNHLNNQIFLPPIKDYGYYGNLLFLPSIRAAPIAYNLTMPGISDDQELNPTLWPERPHKDDQGDPSFMLYVDFERTYLQLSFSDVADPTGEVHFSNSCRFRSHLHFLKTTHLSPMQKRRVSSHH